MSSQLAHSFAMNAFAAALLVGAVACDSTATSPDAAPGIGGNEAGREGGDDAAGREGGDDAAAEGGEDAGGADARATDSAGSRDAPNGNGRGKFFLMDPLPVHDLRPGDDLTRTSRTTEIVGASADGSTIVGVSRFAIATPIPGSETGMAVFRWTEATGVVGLGTPSSLILADPRKGGCDGVTMSSDASVVFGSCVSAASEIHYRWTAVTGFELLPIESPQLSMRATTADGTVLVGDSCCTSLDSFSAFRWSTLSGLTTIHPVPGMTYNTVASVTPAGDVIFGYSSDLQYTYAFRWAPDTGIVTLPRLSDADRCDVIRTPPPRDGSSIVGNCRQQGGSFEAYRWTTTAGVVALGTPAGYTGTHASHVSRDGSVVAGVTGGAGDPAAFRWTATTGSVVIAPAKNVIHMSDDGSVIVGNGALGSGDDRHFRWTAAGAVDLLPLPSDSQSSVTWLSSDGATMVGISYALMTPQRPSRAVTWDADGKAHSIADLLQAAGVDLGGTILTNVSYGDGHLFWGQAIIPSGERRAWVARLP